MNKRGLILVVVVALAGIIAWLIHAGNQSDPVIEGRRLSEWIGDVWQHHDEERAKAMLRNSGTNQVGLLINWYFQPDEDEPGLKWRFIERCNRVINWFRFRGIALPVMSHTEYGPKHLSHHPMAQWALPELSQAGRAVAIPQLINRLTDTNDLVQGGAAYILSRLAPDSIPPLILELSGTNEARKLYSGSALGLMRTNGVSAIRALEKLLSDPALKFRMLAANCLIGMGDDPARCIPVLVQALKEIDTSALYNDLDYELHVILIYTNEARPVVPILLNILKTVPVSTNITNIMIRQDATEGIRQLDPAALQEVEAN